MHSLKELYIVFINAYDKHIYSFRFKVKKSLILKCGNNGTQKCIKENEYSKCI